MSYRKKDKEKVGDCAGLHGVFSAQYRVGVEPRQDPQGVISTTPDLEKKIVGQEQEARSRSLLSIRLLDVL